MKEHRLRKFISDEEIYTHYLGEFEAGRKMNSPLPFRDDSTPSFVVNWINDKLIWKDFGYSGQVCGCDSISLVQELFGINRSEACRRIWDDMIHNQGIAKVQGKTVRKPRKKVREYELFSWTFREYLAYWNRIPIPLEVLMFYNVSPLRELRGYGGRTLKRFSSENPCYHYGFGDGWKIYSPLEKDKAKKFESHEISGVLEGYDQLPRSGDSLYVNSSMKDTMTFRSIGYASLNPTSENNYKVLLTRLPELKARFENGYVVFDNDVTGKNSSLYLQQVSDGWLNPVTITGAKDPSDLVMKYGYFSLLDQLPRGSCRIHI